MRLIDANELINGRPENLNPNMNDEKNQLITRVGIIAIRFGLTTLKISQQPMT